MAYSPEVYRSVSQILDKRRRTAEYEAEQRREKMYLAVPELRQIDYRISGNYIVAASHFSDISLKEKLIEENDELSREKSEIIRKCGYPENYLEPDYHCKKCRDTGRCAGVLCECYIKLCQEEALKMLYMVSQAENCTFDSFNLLMYDDSTVSDGANARRKMKTNYEFCINYAKNFHPSSDSILMIGKTGLGKTHLSLAIASEVTKKGYGTVYVPAQHMISELEKEHFSNEGTYSSEKYCGCDFLIIDDLGSEFITSFSVAAIGNIINERLVRSLPTIISTNFTLDEITQKYTERTASRLFGKYRIMYFLGEDIRQKLKIMSRQGE